jgi:NAD(P)-dependent dehydrogenase (short-subunit alcohol dehydrogenase family)
VRFTARAAGCVLGIILRGRTRRATRAPLWRLARIPLRRMGEPGDMAGAALFLTSPAGAWVTGIVLPVDGGFLAKL